MSFVNFGKREISFKIVYYGPPLSGKTTNLEYLHRAMPDDVKGGLTALSTEQDRTLYFDFLPLASNAISGYVSRFQLFTVPGQPIYDQTRRIVLVGVDGIVFVADSQWNVMEANAESFENLKVNLGSYGRALHEIPYILQFNKRDLADISPVHYLDFLLNQEEPHAAWFESVATEGVGVDAALNRICKMVMAEFIRTHNMSADRPAEPAPAAAAGG